MKKAADHTGSRFDDFLEEENLLAEAEAVAIGRVRAWQAAGEPREDDPQPPA